jgi:hypothetical protein
MRAHPLLAAATRRLRFHRCRWDMYSNRINIENKLRRQLKQTLHVLNMNIKICLPCLTVSPHIRISKCRRSMPLAQLSFLSTHLSLLTSLSFDLSHLTHISISVCAFSFSPLSLTFSLYRLSFVPKCRRPMSFAQHASEFGRVRTSQQSRARCDQRRECHLINQLKL